MPMKRRTMIALIIVGLTLAPALLMVLVTYLGTGEVQAAATWASLPAIAGMAAVASGGRRFAVIAAIVMGFLAPVTIVAGESPVSGAALMAILCMVVGRLTRAGLQKSALLVPIMMAWPLIDPPAWSGMTTLDRTDTTYLLWMAAIFAVGGLVPALVGPLLLRKRALPTPQPHAQGEAVTYTVTITILVTAVTYYVLDNPALYGGAFLIAAILVLAPIGRAHTLRPTILRVLGTLAGSVIVIAIVSQVSSLALIYLIGLVLIVIALIARFGPRGSWVYYVFMMPASACLNATSIAEVGQLGRQRVVDNVIGGVLVLLATAAAIGYASWAERRGHAVDDDPEAAQVLQPA
jgi:hypothetical protein